MVAALGPIAVSLVFAVTAAGAAGHVEPGQRQPSDTFTPITRVVMQRPPKDAFDWLDAAIGGAAVLGLVLVIAGTSVVALRRPQYRAPVDK